MDGYIIGCEDACTTGVLTEDATMTGYKCIEWGGTDVGYKKAYIKFLNSACKASTTNVKYNFYDNSLTACSDEDDTWGTVVNSYQNAMTNVAVEFYKECNRYSTWGDPFHHYTDCHTQWIKYKDGRQVEPVIPIPDRMRQIIQGRQAPLIVTTRKSLDPAKDFREQCARETLRRVLGEELFRNFLARGFISVRAKSGLVYQIFPGHGITKVFNQGKLVERLCVVLRGDFPPTDSIIMRYILILNDEDEFRKHAIKHGIDNFAVKLPTIDTRTLPEIMRELRKAG